MNMIQPCFYIISHILQYFILDVLQNFPCFIFSNKQNDMIHWGMGSHGIPQIPSDNVVKSFAQSLQFAYGVKTVQYEGTLGHVYYANDILTLIAQVSLKKLHKIKSDEVLYLKEISNPLVCLHLHFFPEDNGRSIGNAYEARHWLDEMDGELLTPVVTRGSQRYFIFEPIILEDHTCCIPVRWYMHFGELYAKAWRLRQARLLGPEGWIALEYNFFKFPVSQLAVPFPHFQRSFSY